MNDGIMREYVIMMRTQIQLTDKQAERLRALARERGLSLSELVRQAVDLLLQTEGTQSWEARKQRALGAVGRFASGRGDWNVAGLRSRVEGQRSRVKGRGSRAIGYQLLAMG
jgi:Arc/MetJ-type ribon-helix-helix transcriptional regulator